MLMRRITAIAIVGLVAQLIDGSLGMAYGVTSSTLLLLVGTSPALASASVHLAEVGTTLVSGAAHWRLGNVDWRTFRWLAAPGAVGAFVGALVLGSISGDGAKPFVAALLLGLGVYILIRFARASGSRGPARRISSKSLSGLGLVAGFLDAVGGGGWGPVSTPSLIAWGRMEPRKAVGSVDASEFFVSVAASIGFLMSLGRAGVDLPVVAALLAGGVVAAPVAAWLVRRMHPQLLGTGVGGIIVLTNTRTLLSALEIGSPFAFPTYGVALAGIAVAGAFGLNRVMKERNARALPVPAR
jgi:uncharacterized membrane protein YfcA